MFGKKILTKVFAGLLFISLLISTFIPQLAFAKGGSPGGDAPQVEPFLIKGQKIWIGDDDYPEKRPDELGIYLKKDGVKLEEYTQTTNAGMDWRYGFDLTGLPLDSSYEIGEETVAGYSTGIIQPIKTVTPSITGQWDRVTRKNTLSFDVDTSKIIAIKRATSPGQGAPMFIWTPSPLSSIEKDFIYDKLKDKAGVGARQYWYFRSGLDYLDYDNFGINIKTNKLDFSSKEVWSMWWQGGQLSTYMSFTDSKITNTLTAGSGSLTIKKTVANETEPTVLSNGSSMSFQTLPLFSFLIEGPHGFSKTIELSDQEQHTLDNLLNGTYKVTETQSHGYIPSYSPVNGEVIIDDNNLQATVDVINTSKADEVSVNINGLKFLDDGDAGFEKFDFRLYTSSSNWEEISEQETVQNNGPNINFSPLYFTEEGSFYFLIKEVQGSGAFSYDSTVYRIQIEVARNSESDALEATQHIMVEPVDGWVTTSEIKFSNYSQELPPPSIEVKLEGKKFLTGRELKDEEFTFELYQQMFDPIPQISVMSLASSQPVQTTTNIGENWQFDLTFDGPGVYEYIIREQQGNLPGVSYDQSEYSVYISVYFNNDGELVAELFGADEEPISGDDLVFRNTYRGQPPPPPTTPIADLEVKKIVDKDTFSKAGELLHYSIEVKNTGNLALVKLTVNDERLGITGLEIDLTANPLLPGETYTHTFTEPYTVTQPDIEAREEIINTVTVIGITVEGLEADDEAEATVAFEQTAPAVPISISLEKLVKEKSFTKAGDELHYSFTLVNDGIAAVVKLTVNDPKLGIEDLLIDLSDHPLMPDDSYTYEFSEAYVVTDADIAAEKIVNKLTVVAESAEGASSEAEADVITPREQTLPLEPELPQTGEHIGYRTGIVSLILGGALVLIAINKRKRISFETDKAD